jgi:hypothetical protein
MLLFINRRPFICVLVNTSMHTHTLKQILFVYVFCDSTYIRSKRGGGGAARVCVCVREREREREALERESTRAGQLGTNLRSRWQEGGRGGGGGGQREIKSERERSARER